ncbi:MAG: magnesium transporter [Mycoplasma sp.]|nr:magnesium transporter [Mycoplasma sp.]
MTLELAINQKKIKKIREIAKEIPFADIADTLEKLSTRQMVLFFRLLDAEISADIFSKLEVEYQEKVIDALSSEETKNIIDELYIDDIADLIEEVPSNIAIKIISNTEKEKRKIINKILKYKEDQIGSRMFVEIIKLKKSMTITKALSEIKKQREDSKVWGTIFVTDKDGKYEGVVKLDDLFFEKNTSKKVGDLVKINASLKTTDDVEFGSIQFQKHDHSLLPVVDSNGFLAGVVTSEDIIDVIVEEAEEDFQKMAGISTVDTPYLKTTIKKFVQSRFSWLVLLMVSATISQIVISVFINISNNALNPTKTQATIASLTTALVSIIPVISGSAGNAGSQSSTVITRALATNDVTVKDVKAISWKEFRVSFFVGLLLAIANFIRLIVYYLIANKSIEFSYFLISLGASISLWVVIIVAKMLGSLLPLIAKLFKQDPAVMAAPLLTTMIDSLSTIIFFSINIMILYYAL